MSHDCIGHPCHAVTFKTSDLQPERWGVDGDQNPDETPRYYDFPKPGDPLYDFRWFRQMRLDFEAAGQAEMAKYTPRRSSCERGCKCALSDDPRHSITVKSRVPVTVTYTYPRGGGTATIFGSFLLETTRTEGLCTAGEPVGVLVEPVDEEYALAAFSARVRKIFVGFPEGGHRTKKK